MEIKPKNARDVLSRRMLIDGFEPIIDLVNSHGSWMVDARNKKEYLDFFTMFASMPIGYNHPKVLKQKDRLATAALNKPSNSDIYSIQMAEFVETFFTVAVPRCFKHAFFISGGALAVENALKAAFDWKVKKNFKKGLKKELGKKIIHFRESFHGRSGYTLSLTNTDPIKTEYFPKFRWPRIINPKLRFPLDETILKEVVQTEKIAIKQIKEAFQKNKDDIAGIIIEPIQGEGGDHHFRKEFFQSLRDLADNNEALLIYDEVQTGLGGTGKMWAWQHYGVQPDLMCFGKKVQVCGCLATNRIDDVDNNVFHQSSRINSTWGGNLVDMVRSTMYLEIIRDEKLVQNAQARGKQLLQSLKHIQKTYPQFISNIRGKGLMCAFDLPSASLRNAVQVNCIQNGLLILPCGQRSIRFRPPLNVSSTEIELGMELLKRSLESQL